MSNLYRKFQNLSVSNNMEYSAFKINKSMGHRMAKDKKGNPSLLIDTSNYNSKLHKHKLYNISISHNIDCNIEEEAVKSVGKFTIISYIGKDLKLVSPFIDMCEIFLKAIGRVPNDVEISNIVDDFIELFRLFSEPPKRTLQGLWAELFFIAEHDNTSQLVSAWHQDIEDKYDFSFGDTRVEVKSSKFRKRVHNFSMDQLSSSKNIQIYISSIFVETISNGLSVQDLLDSIEKKLKGNIDLINKIRLLSFSTLGGEINLITKQFDYQLAKESLKIYNAKDVPKILITNTPTGVSSVTFKSSLDGVPLVSYDALLDTSKTNP